MAATDHFLPEGMTLDQYEQSIIREALKRANGNKSQAARLLGLTRNALRYRLPRWASNSQEADVAEFEAVDSGCPSAAAQGATVSNLPGREWRGECDGYTDPTWQKCRHDFHVQVRV